VISVSLNDWGKNEFSLIKVIEKRYSIKDRITVGNSSKECISA
jgi:hypothetical protein